MSDEEIMEISPYKDILPMYKAQDYPFDLRLGKPPGIHGDALEFWLPFAQCGDPGRCRASDGAVILDKWSTSQGAQTQGLADRCRDAVFNWKGSKTGNGRKEAKLPDSCADMFHPSDGHSFSGETVNSESTAAQSLHWEIFNAALRPPVGPSSMSGIFN